jgi:hypothetical protein
MDYLDADGIWGCVDCVSEIPLSPHRTGSPSRPQCSPPAIINLHKTSSSVRTIYHSKYSTLAEDTRRLDRSIQLVEMTSGAVTLKHEEGSIPTIDDISIDPDSVSSTPQELVDYRNQSPIPTLAASTSYPAVLYLPICHRQATPPPPPATHHPHLRNPRHSPRHLSSTAAYRISFEHGWLGAWSTFILPPTSPSP